MNIPSVTRVIALTSLVVATSACPDLVVESADELRGVVAFSAKNPSPRTGESLVLVYEEPLTVYGREVCISFEDDDGVQDGTPLHCASLSDPPEVKEFVVDGLTFDVDYAFQAVVKNATDRSSKPVRTTGRPVKDAPPLLTFTATPLQNGDVTLTWSLPNETFIATGVVVARTLGSTPPASPDDNDAIVVADVEIDVVTVVDMTAPSSSQVSYAAWVRDREGGRVGPLTATVTTPAGAIDGFGAELATSFGAMTGAVNLAWTPPSSSTITGITIVRAPQNTIIDSPSTEGGTVVCNVVAPETGACVDQAAPFGNLTYHAFSVEADGAIGGPAVVDLRVPELRLDVFTAVPVASGVRLTWVLSGDAATVKILRSTSAYALGPDDPSGTLVPNTLSSPFVDVVPLPGEATFYAAFAAGADAAIAGPGRFAQTTPLSGPVENLEATLVDVGGLATGDVLVSWDQPSSGSFSTARVVRKFDVAPASQTDGTIVCDEALISCVDDGVPHGSVTHYAVYARDAFFTFTDEAAHASVVVTDELPPGAVTGLAASRETLPSGSERITVSYTLPTDDVLTRAEVWSANDAPPDVPGDFGAVLEVSDTSPTNSLTFDAIAGLTYHLSVFVRDDAGNVSAPASVFVPVDTGLILESWGISWVPGNIIESWAGDERLLMFDATASGASSCELEADVDDDGPGPGDTTVSVPLVGHTVVKPARTTKYRFRCDTPTGPLESAVKLLVADAAWGWSLTVSPATPTAIVADAQGRSITLVSNQLLTLDTEGNVESIVGFAPVEGFGTIQTPKGVATHLARLTDDSLAFAASLPVVNEDLPYGVKRPNGTVYEGHLPVSLSATPVIRAIAPSSTGKLFLFGDVDASTEIRAGSAANPGTAYLNISPVAGGVDLFVARVDDTGPLSVAVGGSLGPDQMDAASGIPNGGAVFSGTLGDNPALIGDLLLDDNSPFDNAPWGFIATVDESGVVDWAEGLPVMDATHAVAVHPEGGFVVAGRWDTTLSLRISRRGPGLLPPERWTRSASMCCLNDVEAGEEYARFTALAFDDEGTLWAAGTAYGYVEFNGWETNDPDWVLYYPVSKKPRSFIARYTADGRLMFARTIITPEGGAVSLAPARANDDNWLYGLAAVKRSSVLEEVYDQVFGPNAQNEFASDFAGGSGGGAIMKFGPVPVDINPPTNLVAVLAPGPQVSLTWAAPADDSAARVIVVRSSGAPSFGPWREGSEVLQDSNGATSYVDTTPPTATRVFYVVYRASDFPLYRSSELVSVDVP